MSERVAFACDSLPICALTVHRDGILVLESSNTRRVWIDRATVSSRGAKPDAVTCRCECTSRDPLRHLGKMLGRPWPHLGTRYTQKKVPMAAFGGGSAPRAGALLDSPTVFVLARRRGWMVGLAAAGCFPTPDPPWLVGDRAELLAVRIEVTDEGPLSTIVAPVPADRRRTDALPGDTIAFLPWVTDRERVWTDDELDVAYFACLGSSCVDALRAPSGTSSCSDLLQLEQRACALGRGRDARFVLPIVRGVDITALDYTSIFAIAGEPGVIDTDACIDAFRDWPSGEIDRCMLHERRVGIGPEWALLLLLDLDGDDDTTGGSDDSTGDEDSTGGSDDSTGGEDPFAPPPEVYFEWPNFNPEVERFSVAIDRRGEVRVFDHVPGDRILVRPGDDVSVTHERDPRDAQSFVTGEISIDGTYRRNAEVLSEQWFATHPLAPFTDISGVETVRFEVPSDVATFRVDVRLTDLDDGYAWGSLYFEVDGATP